MADVKMPKTIPCKFDLGWGEKCEKPTDNGLCTEHEKAKCVCCGDQATHACDHAVSLCCGALLCDNCTHKPSGSMGEHVTKAEAAKIYKAEREEEDAKRASRHSPEARIDEETGLPVNLFELLKIDWKALGFRLEKAYYLELKHDVMGFFPAVLEKGDDAGVIAVTDMSVLESVWRLLEPRKAGIGQVTIYFNPESGYCYGEASSSHEQEQREPFKIMTQEIFDSIEKPEEVIRWAYGLMSMKQEPGLGEFLQDLEKQAQRLDPSFTSRFN